MESLCQEIVLPEHALRSPEFLGGGSETWKLEGAKVSR